MVLEFLGQAGLRRRHRRKAAPVPPPERVPLLATPSPKKRDLDLESLESSPGPSRKIQRPAPECQDLVPSQGDELSIATPTPWQKLEEADKVKGVDKLLELLLKDYGASSLATSLADRAESCINILGAAAKGGISQEAVEAKAAAMVETMAGGFQRVFLRAGGWKGHGTTATPRVADQGWA
eukprot:Skav236355  [mRNA]  locus=scaffold918:286156:292391:+ [translate_table: standard]